MPFKAITKYPFFAIGGGYATLAIGSLAMAAPNVATFSITHDILQYSYSDSSADGPKQTSSQLQTTPNDVTIGVFWKDYGFYVTPGNTGGGVFFSYFPSTRYEVGVGAAVNNQEQKNIAQDDVQYSSIKSEEMSFTLYGTIYKPIKKKGSFEFTPSFTKTFASSTQSPADGASQKLSDTDSNNLNLTIQYATAIAKHFIFAPGISIDYTQSSNDVDSSRTQTTAYTLKLANFRYAF